MATNNTKSINDEATIPMYQYHALLLLAFEMACELRRLCDNDIHLEQVEEISRLMVESGLSPNY